MNFLMGCGLFIDYCIICYDNLLIDENLLILFIDFY